MENNQQDKKSVKKRLKHLVKTYLITGLVVIIPLWLTYFVVAVLFKWISNFTFPIVNYVIVDKHWVQGIAKISSFFISIVSIFSLGFITNRVFGKSILVYVEKFIERLPVLGTVHSATKQFINFIFDSDGKKNFKQVVFVHYPNRDIYSVAFLTGEQIINGEKYGCVFMPTTPNPTTGFLLLLKEEDIIYTNYTVEQAFQFIISVGVIGMDIDKDGRKNLKRI
ncbi:MAG: DUF502 domain-containing protein [Endomicrobium sp.]|jgi:uncharacterized membrane protein|nr:DUF502 domain-containing protein [Endomicrobium sp.]